jgi:hypothetical protein
MWFKILFYPIKYFEKFVGRHHVCLLHGWLCATLNIMWGWVYFKF